AIAEPGSLVETPRGERRRLDLDVRLDAAFLDHLAVLVADRVHRPPAWKVIVLHRELELASRSRAKPDEVLNASLPEGALSDDDRAAVVLERAGDDLRCARAVLVDENDDRESGERVIGGVVGRDRLVSAAPFLTHDRHVAAHEEVGDGDGDLEPPASVVAKVDDEPLEAVLVELRERLLELVR